ncbi:MAG: hypothetical protein FD145_1071 [Candidatus Saganbacteria bacterium]|uniref:DUF502 domain-containing protein n=1 Tax=Candidatus Saganbacteria bacterium TaxID=2575572 RepID=A0A833L0N2_UNCSA|nr:MAG: hypothetical protein FD145_1071 [Candidatus Saganbacteria bacterium]
MWSRLSNYFLRGLITLLPLLVTIWLLWFMFSFLDGILGNIISLFVGHPLPGLGFIITILLILTTGYFATHVFGAQIFKVGEEILFRIPIVKGIYTSAKQMNEVLFIHKGTDEFRRACVIEYPRKGIYTMGFVTSDAAAEVENKVKSKLINVFIPNTPTPATGFLVMMPAQEVILLEMKTEDAFKYIVSGGVLQPPEQEKYEPA